jgi:hypothetical protein
MNSEPAVVPSQPSAPAAHAFADHLAARHEHISQTWRSAVAAAPELNRAHPGARKHFLRHVSQVLHALERRLRGGDGNPPAAPGPDDLADGADGWPPGNDVREFVLEWGHLHRCLLPELAALRDQRPLLDGVALLALEDDLARLIYLAIADGAGNCQRRQAEALRERGQLEAELANLTEKIRRRAAILRASAHDLRGQLAVITSAAEFIDDPTVVEEMRVKCGGILNRGVHTLKDMLVSLIDETGPDAEHEMRPPSDLS